MVNRLLIVDDDRDFRAIVSTAFKKNGWTVHVTTDSAHAISNIREFDPDLVLMSVDLKGRDGIATCRIIRTDISMSRHYPVILTGNSFSKIQIINALDAGCDDLVTRPLELEVLRQKAEKLVEFQRIKNKRETGEDAKEKRDFQEKEDQEEEIIVYCKKLLEKTFSNAFHDEPIPYQVIENVTKKMLQILHKDGNLPVAFKMKSLNDYMHVHSVNVATLCMTFAYHLKWDDSDLKILGEGGFLHDIGKTKIDLQIVLKEDELTGPEFSTMKKHPDFSRKILAKQNIGEELQEIAIEHHEHLDGKGYPHGICNGQISKHARLLSIVDVYDALTTDRPYKKAADSEEAIEAMSGLNGKFDPEMFDAFKSLVIGETIGK